MSIAAKTLSNGKKTDSCPDSLSGRWTSESLTGGLLEATRAWLTSCPLASHSCASPSQSQASRKESKTKGTSGPKRGIPLASFDPDTSFWRMSQVSLLPLNRLYIDCYGLDQYGGLRDLELSELPMPGEYNLTWPKWGMIVAGELFQLTTSMHHISGKGGGLWRTPSSQIIEAKSSVKKLNNRKPSDPQVGLADQVMWPSPSSEQFDGNVDAWEKRNELIAKDPKSHGKSGIPLAIAVKKWPTPRKEMAHGYCKSRIENPELAKKECRLEDQVMGNLNPTWVSWLQGWPLAITKDGEITDWTDSRPLKELIWLSWDIDPADMQEPNKIGTPTQLDAIGTKGRSEKFQTKISTLTEFAIKNQGVGIIPRVAVKIPNRVNRLKALGNGQVPLCAAVAWEILNGH